MGAGNKLDAGRLKIADIYETSVCPLAKVMRRELKKRGVEHLKVVYSDEEPIRPLEGKFGADADGLGFSEDDLGFSGEGKTGGSRRSVPGSTAFVPAVAGLLIAGEIVRDLSKAAR